MRMRALQAVISDWASVQCSFTFRDTLLYQLTAADQFAAGAAGMSKGRISGLCCHTEFTHVFGGKALNSLGEI